MSQLAYSHSTPAGFATSATPVGPRQRFDPHAGLTSAQSTQSSVYPSSTVQPMPSPGDYDGGQDPNFADDWHPSRVSLADDGAMLLPRGGNSSGYEAPGGWRRDDSMGGAGDLSTGGGADDEDEDNIHYGPVPSRVPRRNKTVKRIKYVFWTDGLSTELRA